MKKSTLRKSLSLMLTAVLTLSLSGITVFAENAAEDDSTAIISELPAETPGGAQAPETPEASDDPSAPPAAEPTVEPTAEPEQPLPTELPQVSLSEYAISVQALDGAVIAISGLLPEGAYVTAEPVAVTLEDGVVLAAYDIKIFDGKGSEWQPGESVSVSIDSPAIADADEVTIYHMEDASAPAEEVATVNVAGTEVAFEAESFSIYAVVSSKYFKDSYTAYAGDTVTLENWGLLNAALNKGDWSIKSGSDVVQFTTDTNNENTVTVKALKVGTAVIECKYTRISSNRFTIKVEDPKQKVIDMHPDGVKAKVYLYFNNTVPAKINQPFAAGQFGPKGDDTPYFEVTVNVAQLLADPKITVEWTNNNTRWYISAQSPGAGYTSEELWSKILACMSAEDQAKFSAIGAGTYMGYVLKNEGAPHIDGVLTVDLPYYRTELYIDGQFAKYLAAENNATHKETEVKDEFLALLKAKYSDSSLTINWANQTFTSNGKIYYLKLNAPSHGTTGVGFENNGKQKYEKQNGVNFYLACQYIDIIADQEGTSVPGFITISGTKTWNDSNDAAHARPATLGLILKKNGAATDAVPVWTKNGNTWAYTFTVPYDESRPAYTVEEMAPANYSGSASSEANTGYNMQFSAITRVTNGNDDSYGPYTANFVIAKLTANEGYVIWTARQISSTEQAQLLTIAAGINGMSPSPTSFNTVFVVGNGAKNYNPDKGYTTFNYAGDKVSIDFEKSKVWSQFAYGVMTTTYTPENGNLTNTYVPPVYTVTYQFISGTSGKTLPAGLIPSEYGYVNVTNALTGAIYSTSKIFTSYLDSANDGVWTFQSWDHTTQTISGNDITFIGTWAFTPNTYTLHVNYVFADNNKPGTGFADYSTPGYTQGSGYSAVAIAAPAGYTRSDSGNISGQFGSTDITVTYTYTPNDSATVHVQYFLKETEVALRGEQTATGLIGTAYGVLSYKLNTVEKDGRFYDLVNNPGDGEFSGTYAAGGKTIKLYYAERTYSAPHGTKIVSGLASLPDNYQVTLELRGPNGAAIATIVLKAEDFEKQEDGTFIVDFRFDAPAEEGPVLFALESLSLPAGTYTVVETSISSVSGMNLAAPAYSLTIFNGEETPAPTATNQIPLGVDGENSEYRFTVTNAYSAIYYPPVDPTPGPTPTPPIEIPEEETPLTPTPPVEIPEEEVPLSPAPEEESAVEIIEEETPLAPAPAADKTIPQTGDNSATALFAILAVLSATGLAVLGFGGKKKERDSN